MWRGDRHRNNKEKKNNNGEEKKRGKGGYILKVNNREKGNINERGIRAQRVFWDCRDMVGEEGLSEKKGGGR